MSRDDTERLAAETSAATLRDNLNQTNVAANTAKLAVVTQAITALPAPVNFAARTLGEGLYAAFKTKLDGVRQPAPANADPIKLMAYSMAFAILRAMWCFIKSILNPLPFIGSFFPLCPNDPDAIPGEVANDPDNRLLTQASARFGESLQEAYTGSEILGTSSDPSQNFSGTDGPFLSDYEGGMTFDEYVSATVGREQEAVGVGGRGGQGVAVAPTPASVGLPQSPTPTPTSSAIQQQDEFQVGFDDLRRGFGL